MMNLTTEQILAKLREETAAEMGIQLGADTTASANGSVGGRMTQKLIALGKIQLEQMVQEQGFGNVELTAYLNNQNNEQQLH